MSALRIIFARHVQHELRICSRIQWRWRTRTELRKCPHQFGDEILQRETGISFRTTACLVGTFFRGWDFGKINNFNAVNKGAVPTHGRETKNWIQCWLTAVEVYLNPTAAIWFIWKEGKSFGNGYRHGTEWRNSRIPCSSEGCSRIEASERF